MLPKVRRLFIGVRYISHVFGEEEKKDEIQIGNPTEVKHVAHIGYESSVERLPTWMDDFKQGNDQANESDTLVATDNTVGVSSGEESPQSSSQQVSKTKSKLRSKQPGSKRRKDGGAPTKHKTKVSDAQLSDEEEPAPAKPNRTRRRRKPVVKKDVANDDDGSLSSTPTSSNPNCAPCTDDPGSLDKSIYESAYGAGDSVGSSESFGTVVCEFEGRL